MIPNLQTADYIRLLPELILIVFGVIVMLAEPMVWNWVREPIRAAVNALVGVVIFALLDKTKREYV